MSVIQKTGVMEKSCEIELILEKWLCALKEGEGLKVTFIPNSKNHNNKPMMHISESGWDVPIYNLEVSEEGIFAYVFDDGVS